MSQSPQWIATARLLRRIGFGASGPQIDAVVSQDWSTYLDAALNSEPEADPGAKATPMPKLVIPPRPGPTAGAEAMRDFSTKLDQQMDQLSAWWLRRMAKVEQPIHEKLTLLWHNHFATSREKVRAPDLMATQNQTLRALKLGDFRTLAYAMLVDSAMLKWLDGNLNTAAAPNENLSREFMELFALGHGNGYTQTDVIEGARALTGWTITSDVAAGVGQVVGGESSFDAKRFDPGEKTVLGVTGNLDAAGFCDAVLAQPTSAGYVAARLWRQLASDDDPSPQTLDRLVAAYGPGRDLKALTKAILMDPEFIARSGTVVNPPVEWLMGVIRSLSVSIDDWERLKAVYGTLGKLGQRPFFPPDVSGWPSGQPWLSTASVGVRAWAASQLAQSGDLSVVESAPKGDRVDAVGYLIGVGAWSDRTASALKPLAGDPTSLVTAAVNSPEYLTS
jgi:uncharacterized protein (DUF1800 family)